MIASEGAPIIMKIYTQSNTYNKQHYCNATVFLYKVRGQITERSISCKYDISKSLCPYINMILI